MCGIVGLFLKDPGLEPALGLHLSRMLATMCDRGPDSAGLAVYGEGAPGRIKLTLRGPRSVDFDRLAASLGKEIGHPIKLRPRATHAVATVPDDGEEMFRAALSALAPDVTVVGAGTRMEVYKEVGLPTAVASAFGLEGMGGTHGIGHTRMATESAVITDGAHPFSTGPDQCLVHNGSLSNHNGVRRRLAREGLPFATENDSEVAAAYLTWRMREGASLGEALESALDALDGFYTFVVGTRTGFGVLRDPIACKPAVLAETEGYVAFASEYRALAGLPGIATARVWEPEPATVYFWERHP
jgi:glutamate synthase domain-containing protein 1